MTLYSPLDPSCLTDPERLLPYVTGNHCQCHRVGFAMLGSEHIVETGYKHTQTFAMHMRASHRAGVALLQPLL